MQTPKLAAALLTLLAAFALAPSPAAARQPTVWFTPANDSADYADLFEKPQLWAATRGKVDVFQVSPAQVEPGKPGSPSKYADLVRIGAFRDLKQWGIDIAVEAPSVKEWDCTAIGGARLATIRFIKSVAAAGAAIKYVATDEPLVSGTGACHLSMDDAAAHAAAYAKALLSDKDVAANAPGLMVGDVEAYPSHSADQIVLWTRALERNGYKPAFLHLDVDVNDVNARGPKLNLNADLQTLKAFFHGEGIPFGIIMWPGTGFEPSDQTYYNHVMSWAQRVHAAIGRPEQIVFESWVTRASPRCVAGTKCRADNKFMCAPTDPPTCGKNSVPANLPESGPGVFSHTKLIDDALGVLR
jgi:hypothetical protein